ncbi:FLUCTUATING-LIGHT-ACCLIMATION protein 1, chloroplastic-like [Bidens hawaiensis]|uniref:FLUCTUATING-LIGHT-ACCLIMATION protein 1, chloroplastic-like n=1 Tax=Bidens hawaiensis TaxID=980011 RepID=UPI004048F45B
MAEIILSLLRHSEYYISGYSSVDVKKSVLECEKRLDQLSIEERSKFDEETLVNVDNIKKRSTTSQSSNGLPNEYIVVTIIVAARGDLEPPPIKSSEELKNALQKLASVSSSNIVRAEVLWTPQKEDDSLTEQEMLEDYPLLYTF